MTDEITGVLSLDEIEEPGVTDEITGVLTIDLAEDLHPTTAEVGAILRARTRSDTAGAEIGDFDDSTRPTGDEVEAFINSAQDEVLLRLPDMMPLRVVEFTRRLIALRAAMFVETSYDPDRIGDGSAYDRLKEQFDTGMAALQDRLEDTGEATTKRIASPDIVSPTLAPYPDAIREAMSTFWPVP